MLLEIILNWITRIISCNIVIRGGVLEDVLGHEDVFEDRFWSPWPWPRSRKSSKIAQSLARGQYYFLNRRNFIGKRQIPRGKFAKTFFCCPQVEIAWKKLLKTFFLRVLEKIFWKSFFGEHLRLCPWSLASRGSVLGQETALARREQRNILVFESTDWNQGDWHPNKINGRSAVFNTSWKGSDVSIFKLYFFADSTFKFSNKNNFCLLQTLNWIMFWHRKVPACKF